MLRQQALGVDLSATPVYNSGGGVTKYDPDRITRSITDETNLDPATAEAVAEEADNYLRLSVGHLGTPPQHIDGGMIRMAVCAVLLNNNLMDAYEKYFPVQVPVHDLDRIHSSGINENSNQSMNPEATHSWMANNVMERYVKRTFPPEVVEAHLSGLIHIHDLRHWDRPFCQEYDLRVVLANGIPPINYPGVARSRPAKNAIVAATHAAKWLAIMQSEFSGGQGYDNFTTLLAPYVAGLSYASGDPNETTITQVAQCFVFETQQVFAARGGQSPFTSVTCEPCISEDLEDVPAIGPGGKVVGVYGDYEEEAKLLFRALVDVFAEGDADGRVFPFPKHEVKVTRKGMRVAEDEYRYCAERETAKMGSTYFLNGLAPWMPKSITSQCCRIILSKEEVLKYCVDPEIFDPAKHFNNMGSIQSVSLNLPRCALLAAQNGTTVEGEIDRAWGLIEEVHLLKLEELTGSRQMPNEGNWRIRSPKLQFCRGMVSGPGIEPQPIVDLRKCSASIGIVGLNECVLVDSGFELHEPGGFERGKEILQHMSEAALKSSQKHQFKFSLWEQPAESTAGKFAKRDAEDFGDRARPLGDDMSNYYYTNSNHLRYDVDEVGLGDLIRLQGEYHPIVQGGVITHIWLGEQSPDPNALWQLTKNICTRTNTAYFSFTFDFSYCTACRYFAKGRVDGECPQCGASEHAIEWYSKITGYYSRVKRWNESKIAEWHDRSRRGVDPGVVPPAGGGGATVARGN